MAKNKVALFSGHGVVNVYNHESPTITTASEHWIYRPKQSKATLDSDNNLRYFKQSVIREN